MKSFTTAVVGVSFCPEYPENLQRLEAAALIHFGDLDHYEPLAATLEREPDNPHDPNAVAVHVPSVGLIGHVPRGVAARLAPQLDSGTRYLAGVERIRNHPDHPDRPGIDLIVTKQEHDA